MLTPTQIKEYIQYEEIDRCRRVAQEVEHAIKRNFDKGVIDMSVANVEERDRGWVVKDLEEAGYVITEETVVVGPYSYKKTYIKWEIPNE